MASRNGRLKTASRDLGVLIDKRILEKIGTTGKGTHYIMK